MSSFGTIDVQSGTCREGEYLREKDEAVSEEVTKKVTLKELFEVFHKTQSTNVKTVSSSSKRRKVHANLSKHRTFQSTLIRFYGKDLLKFFSF